MPPASPRSPRRSLGALLLDWYDRARRDLPWRRDASPYRTLVSELMLQQTVVATVEPYFERFVARFPSLGALAEATEEEVLAAWAGLGYYARARNLHRAARVIVADHGGALPRTEHELRALPGVGPYTAAAIAAIAFDAPAFALDGNAARVFARLHAVRGALGDAATRAELATRGRAEVPAERPGDFAQAVMELGALVCTPRHPRCEDCPVRRRCRALAEGLVASIPARGSRPARRTMDWVCALVSRGGRVLVERRRAGLLAGTWMLPGAELAAGRSIAEGARAVAAALGLVLPRAARPVGNVRHVFTHRDVTAHVFRVPVPARHDIATGNDLRWVDAREPVGVALSTFTRKTLAAGAAVPRAKRDKAAEPT